MFEKKTPEDILEQQRAEATKKYSQDVSELQDKANSLKATCANMEGIIASAVAYKIKELNDLIDANSKEKIDIENKNNQAQQLLKEASVKMDLANRMFEEATQNKLEHSKNVESHLQAMTEGREAIANRHALCAEREAEAQEKLISADNRISESSKKEESIILLQSELNKIKEEVENKMKQHTELAANNKFNLDRIEIINADLQNREDDLKMKQNVLSGGQSKLEEDRQALVVKKNILDDKDTRLKELSIKNSVEMQRLQDKQKEINFNVGKLNELKNNVDNLMKTQEKGA